MTAPKCILDTLAALRSERVPLASRIDAIDLTIDNLSRVYGLGGETQAQITFERRKKPRVVNARKAAPVDGDSSEAAARRSLLLQAIGRSEVGMTISDLRKATPKMSGKDRSNAVQQLKARGEIRRAGNAWMKTANAA